VGEDGARCRPGAGQAPARSTAPGAGAACCGREKEKGEREERRKKGREKEKRKRKKGRKRKKRKKKEEKKRKMGKDREEIGKRFRKLGKIVREIKGGFCGVFPSFRASACFSGRR
jgi:hypothetical protein